MSLSSHYWTVAPSLLHRVAPVPGPPACDWEARVPDASLGSVRLTGLLAQAPGATGLVLVVHGMGGRPTSHYCQNAAAAAARAGFSSLRLALRGADRSGEDFYHAGLTADLRAALGCDLVRSHRDLFVLGYSLGGHVSLKLAVEERGVHVRAVAVACAPLDLVTCAHALDNEVPRPYREYLLGGLKSMYAEVARRRPVPAPVAEVRRARTVRRWDELAVVPRHGFASVDAYYRGESVAPRLGELRVPALVVAAERDPMVPVRTVHAATRGVHGLDVRVVARGGHVGFPRRLDLGMGGALGLEDQVMSWFARHESGSAAD